MSYYSERIEEMQRAGGEVEEVAEEAALVADSLHNTYVLLGGDAPTAWSVPATTTVEDARRLVEVARAVGAVDELAKVEAELGAQEVPWAPWVIEGEEVKR